MSGNYMVTPFYTHSQPGSLTLLMVDRWSSTLYFVNLSAPEFLNKNYWLSDNFLYQRVGNNRWKPQLPIQDPSLLFYTYADLVSL